MKRKNKEGVKGTCEADPGACIKCPELAAELQLIMDEIKIQRTQEALLQGRPQVKLQVSCCRLPLSRGMEHIHRSSTDDNNNCALLLW